MNRAQLTTERRNPQSRDIDRCSTLQIVRLINAEDRRVAPAVGREAVRIAAAVDLIAERMQAGGRLFYVGAGTSGRLGVLDASECPPTFGTRPPRIQGVIAGGRRALVRSAEGAEDVASGGAEALVRKRLSRNDVVAGIAACGLTPFVRGAIAHARRIGAATIFVTCAPEVVAGIRADVVINPIVGPEAVTGSTRMKAGTATKLVLNTLTTGAMIKLGKVYGNLMVDLRATNEKLRDRAERIVAEACGVQRRKARGLLDRAGGSAKVAILIGLTGLDPKQAALLLKRCRGRLREAIAKGG